MEKKNYQTPAIEVISTQTEGVLCVSDPLLLPGVNWGTPTDW